MPFSPKIMERERTEKTKKPRSKTPRSKEKSNDKFQKASKRNNQCLL
jgi:hypothetical protein